MIFAFSVPSFAEIVNASSGSISIRLTINHQKEKTRNETQQCVDQVRHQLDRQRLSVGSSAALDCNGSFSNYTISRAADNYQITVKAV
jgi:hypothetical protein